VKLGITLYSPAKINLFLQVIRRRADGFHELATLLQAIDLCDVIQFEAGERTSLFCSDPRIPTDGSNLILKAVHIFQRRTLLSIDVAIRLTKNIPIQAGLGGGSSNAATTLWALNQLYGEPASLEELQQWAGEIGSDVPFFLSQGTAYCTGRGETVESLVPLPVPSTPLWIIKPNRGLSTPLIYGKLELSRLVKRDPRKALREFVCGGTGYYNDLEGVAIALLPQLSLLREQLLADGFRFVTMTGSGSSLFCFGDRTPHLSGYDAEAFSASYTRRSPDAWYLPSSRLLPSDHC